MADEPVGEIQVVNLAALVAGAGARRIAWAMRSRDLNANLLVLSVGEGVEEHVNTEVDVLLVGMAGEGAIVVDGHVLTLRAGQALLIPVGARRAIRAVTVPFAYLTCHRRRAGLWPRGAAGPE